MSGQEPRWVPAVAVRALHHAQILEHGGLQGIRSATALEAALARPRQRWMYRELSTVTELAAAYAERIVQSHPFADGNKRSGFLVAVVFLGLNGFCFNASNASVVLTIRRLAAAELPWTDLETWFNTNSSRLS
ncbi:MAG: type II toxin-antitoxin system death-on-curing family toxin [Vulcanococcus sp.]